jgi:zinc transporter ZupT
MFEINSWTVFIAALITALATGLGALPFFFVKHMRKRAIGIYDSIAAGLVIGACFGLVNEGGKLNLWLMLLGVVVGMLLITLINRRLSEGKDTYVKRLAGAAGLKALLIVGIMTMHSFAEGIGVGVAYGGGQTLGIFITLAIAIHNIPEGLAISLVLVPAGTSPTKASFWSIFSSLPQPLMAVPAFLLVTLFNPFLPFGLGLAAGAMLWMAFSELIPGALKKTSAETVATITTMSLAAMVALQYLL